MEGKQKKKKDSCFYLYLPPLATGQKHVAQTEGGRVIMKRLFEGRAGHWGNFVNFLFVNFMSRPDTVPP